MTYDKSAQALIPFRPSAARVKQRTKVPFKYLSTCFNLFQSCSLLWDTLVQRKAMGKCISGLSCFATYKSSAIMLWNNSLYVSGRLKASSYNTFGWCNHLLCNIVVKIIQCFSHIFFHPNGHASLIHVSHFHSKE